MKKTKIGIVIPVWERPEVLQVVVKNLEHFVKKTYYDFRVCHVLSATDKYFDKNMEICLKAKYDKKIIFANNNYLGHKHNVGIKELMKDCDYVMNLGSDNLIHPAIMDLYKPYIDKKEPFFGVNCVYFYEKGEKPFFYSYYNHPHLVGCGRMIHKTVLKTVFQKFKGLYLPAINRGMDTQSEKRINQLGIKPVSIEVGTFPYFVDIKSETNITPIARIKNYPARITYCEKSFLHKHFKYLKYYGK